MTGCARPRPLLAIIPAILLGLPLSPLVGQSYRDLAMEAALKGENEKAVKNYELALNSAVKIFAEDDIEIVIRRGELGEAYRAVGRWKEAIEQLDYAWRRARYDAEKNQRWLGREGDLAMGFAEKLGRACQAAGRYDDAVMAFETCVSDAERTGRPAGDVIAPAGLLADTCLLLQRDDDADKAAARAANAARKIHATEPPALARHLSALAMIYQGQLRPAKALPLAKEALSLAEKHFPGEARDLGLYQSRVGSLMVMVGGEDEAAKKLLFQSRENLLKGQTGDAVDLLVVEQALAQLALREGDFDLSQKHNGEAWRICKMHYPAEHPETGRCYRQLAENFQAMGMTEDAAGLQAKALAVFEGSLGKDHPLATETRLILAKTEADLINQRERKFKEAAMIQAEEKAKTAAAEMAKKEEEERLRKEAEEKARMEAETKAKAEEEKARMAMVAQQEAEEKARKAEEEKLRMAAEKARLAAEEKARMKEAKDKKAAEEAMLAQARAEKAAAEKARMEEEKTRMAQETEARARMDEEKSEKAKMAAADKKKREEEIARNARAKAESARKKAVASAPKPKPSATEPKPEVAAMAGEQEEEHPEKRKSLTKSVTGAVTGAVSGASDAVTGVVSGASDAVTGTMKRLFNRKKDDAPKQAEKEKP